MYELKEGSKRLARALYAVQNDDYTVHVLARLLCYYPEQLKLDMQALYDLLEMNRKSCSHGGERNGRI